MECCVLNNIKFIKYTLAPTVLYAAEEAVDPIQCSFILNDPNDNAAFLPFGSGMRACVGQKFAIHGVATLFASLLQRYEVCAKLQLFFNFIKEKLSFNLLLSLISCSFNLVYQYVNLGLSSIIYIDG
jgi:hypothetical protein